MNSGEKIYAGLSIFFVVMIFFMFTMALRKGIREDQTNQARLNQQVNALSVRMRPRQVVCDRTSDYLGESFTYRCLVSDTNEHMSEYMCKPQGCWLKVL